MLTDIQLNSPNNLLRQRGRVYAIRARLGGDDTCAAEGITAHGVSPVLALCRKLVEAGVDPQRPLYAYRGDTLCLRIRSVGEAATLDVNSKGSDFVRCRQAVRTAPPVAREPRETRPGAKRAGVVP